MKLRTHQIRSRPLPAEFKNSKETPAGWARFKKENESKLCTVQGCREHRSGRSLRCLAHSGHEVRTGHPTLPNISPASSARLRKLISQLFTACPEHVGLDAAIRALHGMVRFKKRYSGVGKSRRTGETKTQPTFPATSRVFSSDSRVKPVDFLANVLGHILYVRAAHPYDGEKYLYQQVGKAAHRFARQVPIDSPYGPLYRTSSRVREARIEGQDLVLRLEPMVKSLEEAFALTRRLRADLSAAFLPDQILAALEYETEEPEAPTAEALAPPAPPAAAPEATTQRVRANLERLRKSTTDPHE